MGESIQILTGLVSLVASFILALWAYTKFVIERGLLPPVQFDIECRSLDIVKDQRIIEVLIHLKNLGSATLVAQNIRLDIKYLESGDVAPKLFSEGKLAGRLDFPRSLIKKLRVSPDDLAPPVHPSKPDTKTHGKQRGFSVMPYDTIVRPAVDQLYTFVTAIPADAAILLAWSSFQYAQRPSKLQNIVLRISRSLGLIQYSLQHIHEPHKVERAFSFPIDD